MNLKEIVNALEEPEEGKAMNLDLHLYRQTLGGKLSIDAMLATLNKSQDEKAHLWDVYVLRQALNAYGAYIGAAHLDRWEREDLEQYVKEALPRLEKTDLHALMVVAQVLEGAKVNI
ncbi:MAG: hypothetical protein JXA21_17160 [Anaerolineae bacterium]|nr:hypothetical protein [Anaerolineae bacterium]